MLGAMIVICDDPGEHGAVGTEPILAGEESVPGRSELLKEA